MKVCKVTVESASPYTQTRFHNTPRLNGENPADHEKRTWREKLSCDESGEVFISPLAFKNAVANAAKNYPINIPGQGKARYTKHIEAGVMVIEPLKLGVKKDEVEGMWLHVPTDGKRGGSKRVEKCFPVIHSWKGVVTFHILDDVITKEVFEECVKKAGAFIGVGSLRPQNNGYWGRFNTTKFEWSTLN